MAIIVKNKSTRCGDFEFLMPNQNHGASTDNAYNFPYFKYTLMKKGTVFQKLMKHRYFREFPAVGRWTAFAACCTFIISDTWS